MGSGTRARSAEWVGIGSWPIVGALAIAGDPPSRQEFFNQAFKLAGRLSVRDAMIAYRAALHANIRQVRGLRAGGVIAETELAPGSHLAGRLVSDVAWPKEVVLVAVERDGALLVPRRDSRLLAGDHVSIFATPAAQSARRVQQGQR